MITMASMPTPNTFTQSPLLYFRLWSNMCAARLFAETFSNTRVSYDPRSLLYSRLLFCLLHSVLPNKYCVRVYCVYYSAFILLLLSSVSSESCVRCVYSLTDCKHHANHTTHPPPIHPQHCADISVSCASRRRVCCPMAPKR